MHLFCILPFPYNYATVCIKRYRKTDSIFRFISSLFLLARKRDKKLFDIREEGKIYIFIEARISIFDFEILKSSPFQFTPRRTVPHYAYRWFSHKDTSVSLCRERRSRRVVCPFLAVVAANRLLHPSRGSHYGRGLKKGAFFFPPQLVLSGSYMHVPRGQSSLKVVCLKKK